MLESWLWKSSCLVWPAAFIAFPQIVSGAGTAERISPQSCTYEMQVWNVNLRGSAETRKVLHAYDETAPSETDAATGCTVCSEDQVEVRIPHLQPFSVCWKLAPRVGTLVGELMKHGAAISSVTGYHAIRSRGPVDREGNRTGFSNHSFGTAIDINAEQNGLYDNCCTFGPQCRLLRGGEWHPGTAGSLTRDDSVVRSFKAAGFKWGGEIEGKQKDFMHFSLTGY